MNVVILEDKPEHRTYAQKLLRNSERYPNEIQVYPVQEYPRHGIAPLCMQLARIQDKLGNAPHGGIDVIVLDLHLGRSMWDGFEVVRAIQHAYPHCRFVVNSSQHEDKETRQEAYALGIRYGNVKNSESLPLLVRAAEEAGNIRAGTVGWALTTLQQFVTPCEGVGYTEHIELMQLALRFGLSYTGARADVDQHLLRQIGEMGKRCIDAAEKMHYAFAARRREGGDDHDGDYFENAYTTLCFMAELPREVEKSLAKTDRHVTYKPEP